jgi:HEPN domain-containing protein
MNPAIDEARRYLALAADDAVAFRGMLSVPEIKFRLACFHAQQSVEKSLKAVLVLRGIEQRRTHDLNLLAQLLVDQDIKPPYSPEELTRLNPFAVTFRYDDCDIPLITATEVNNIVTRIHRWATDLVR